MNLDKATKKLESMLYETESYIEIDERDAIRLGTEALKMIEKGRTKPGGQFFHDLPSETED